MLNLVLPETRIAIAHARRQSMGGQEQAALDRLEQAVPAASGHPIDQAAILLAKAELLYLAGRYGASHQVFVNELESLMPNLPHPVALVVGFNRCEVAMARLDSGGTSRYYDLVDEERIMRVEHWGDSALESAISSAARGRSYESLPAIWRELLRTYRQGRWSVFRHVSRYMVEECLRIGLPQEAAFHAAIALDSDSAKRIGTLLMESRDAVVIAATLGKLLLAANLQKHFRVACELIQTLSDVVPDSLVDQVLYWALQRCASADTCEDFNSTETAAWKTVEALAARASTDTAQRIITVACDHWAWTATAERPNQFIRVREEIVDAVNQAVFVVPVEGLRELADATIPLATERRNFKDYNNVIALLSHIADRATDELKVRIASALFLPGQPVPAVLLQAAHYFGKEIEDKGGQWERYAAQVADTIRHVVQRVSQGQQPTPVPGTVMTFNSGSESDRLVVHIVSSEDVWALARHRSEVPVESRRAVVMALLGAISHPDNLFENKVSFIDCVQGFADSLDAPLAEEVFRVLAPIASGDIAMSPEAASSRSEPSPLSRTSFTGATRQQVSARALYVLACVEHHSRPGYGERLQTIVRGALSDNSPDIRKAAFAAVREIPIIDESTWPPLLLGTRDPNADAAALAFDAISARQDVHLAGTQWKMTAYSLRIAQLSRSIRLRKAAAMAASRLEPQTPNEELRAEFSAIRKVFADDVAHSVRAAATMAQEQA